MRMAPAFVMLLLLLPPLHASCRGDVYHLSPGSSTELMSLTVFDLNPEAGGQQGSIAAAPLQRIEGRIGWVFGEAAATRVEAELLGNWSEQPLARLYSGSAIPGQEVASSFGFFAPPSPGSYALTVRFTFKDGCATAYAHGEVVVLNTSPALYVEITSPLEEVLSEGDVLVVDALHTPGASPAVYINGSLKSSTLPYRWDTSGLPPGRYPLVVNISLGNRTASASRVITLVKPSTAPPGSWILPPGNITRVVATSGGMVAVGRGELYLLGSSGELLGRVATSPAPLVSAYDGGFVVAEGDKIVHYAGVARQWNASTGGEVVLLAASRERIALFAGSELHLYNTAGALLWRKVPEFTPELLEVSGEGIAAAAGGRVVMLSGEGAPLWRVNLNTSILDLEAGGDVLYLLLGDEVVMLSGGRVVRTLPLDHNATVMDAGGGYLLLASPGRVDLMTREGEPVWTLRPLARVVDISLAPDGSAALVLSGGRILRVPTGKASTSAPAADARLIYALAALLLLGGGALLLRRRRQEAGAGVEAAERRLRVRVTGPGGGPISGAAVRMGDAGSTTDASGRAELPAGEAPSLLRVEKEGFAPREVEVPPGEGEVQVELRPAGELPPEVRATLGELRRSVAESCERISVDDPCLPVFFRRAAEEVLRGAEEMALLRGMGAVEAAGYAVELLIEAMQDWKNLAVSASSRMRSAEGCEPPPFSTGGEVDSAQVERRLQEADERLTSLLGELSIHPPASLWRVSKKLLERAESASPEQKEALLGFASYLLLCLEHMLKSEEVLMRLRGSHL
ncbi:MAG: carboxypeptidase regulatory-like domain-containing protein [Euryarchaeota archaeon]|nr:carboxypeptidase regulatory-like domain-containing protein [Euryarchaeota archaeon]